MKKDTLLDYSFILESLRYTKMRFQDYPIGDGGYQSYDAKMARIRDVDQVIENVKKHRDLEVKKGGK